MEKLKLEPDALEVQGFDPVPAAEEMGGTVEARLAPTTQPCSYIDLCPTRPC